MPDAPPGYEPFSYPAHRAHVTAERIVQHLTAEAQTLAVETRKAVKRAKVDDADGAEIYFALSAAWVNQYALIHILREFIKAAPDRAEQAVAAVWEAWEDGGLPHELVWQWGKEYGVPRDGEMV